MTECTELLLDASFKVKLVTLAKWTYYEAQENKCINKHVLLSQSSLDVQLLMNSSLISHSFVRF